MTADAVAPSVACSSATMIFQVHILLFVVPHMVASDWSKALREFTVSRMSRTGGHDVAVVMRDCGISTTSRTRPIGRVASGQGKVRENFYFSRSGKSQGILWKVRENLWMEESQGIVREFCDECPQYIFYGSRHPFVPHLSASYGSRLHKSLHLFWCYVIFSAHNSFPGRKYVFAAHSLLTYHT